MLGLRLAPPGVAAVEVPAAGCSYNPPEEAHQEALALAVGAEVERNLKEELHPVQPMAPHWVVQENMRPDWASFIPPTAKVKSTADATFEDEPGWQHNLADDPGATADGAYVPRAW